MGDDEGQDLLEHNPSRAHRAKLLSGVSLTVVAIACILYLRPSLQPAVAPAPAVPASNGQFQLDAVDFINPSTGWILEDLDDFQFAVLGTVDAGQHWRPELLEPTILQGEYMRFFDAEHGVVSTVGGDPQVYTTQDGGRHWRRHVVNEPDAFAISASFSDPLHGWELMGAGSVVPSTSPVLMRTSDGGATWKRLGATVPAMAQPFAVSFGDPMHGWLDTVADTPVAYSTEDGGATWHAVTLPTPLRGWPVAHGQYFVAVRPVLGGGLVASVVNAAHVSGHASGLDVLGYPPLTVRTFDGGGAVVYVYSTFVDSPFSGVATDNRPGPQAQLQAANQTVMRSVDGGHSWTVVVPPSSGGTLGFAGSLEWWWVGSDAMAITHDGGVTWSPVRIETLDQPVPGSLVLLDAKHAWVGAVVKGGTLLYSTSDGGARWSLVSLPTLKL
jgi:photosystem II stability/assembly factor-like uncharacterized protein